MNNVFPGVYQRSLEGFEFNRMFATCLFEAIDYWEVSELTAIADVANG